MKKLSFLKSLFFLLLVLGFVSCKKDYPRSNMGTQYVTAVTLYTSDKAAISRPFEVVIGTKKYLVFYSDSVPVCESPTYSVVMVPVGEVTIEVPGGNVNRVQKFNILQVTKECTFINVQY